MVERFLGVLGLSYLLAEPDYSDNARRMANRPSLNARINAVTRGKPVDHWIEAINKAGCPAGRVMGLEERSEEHTSELQSLMRTSYAVFCLKQNNQKRPLTIQTNSRQKI